MTAIQKCTVLITVLLTSLFQPSLAFSHASIDCEQYAVSVSTDIATAPLMNAAIGTTRLATLTNPSVLSQMNSSHCKMDRGSNTYECAASSCFITAYMSEKQTEILGDSLEYSPQIDVFDRSVTTIGYRTAIYHPPIVSLT